ncbi:hypothetical protein ACWGBV_05125, partial [Streptomyces sp. NPDC055051]
MDLRTASSPSSVSSSSPAASRSRSSSLSSSSASSRTGPGSGAPRRGAPPGRARRRVRVRRVPVPPGPGGGGAGVVRERGDALFPPAVPAAPDSVVVVEERAPVGAGERRWRAAVRERLPLWVQTRCGLEPRSLAALGVVLVVAVCA